MGVVAHFGSCFKHVLGIDSAMVSSICMDYRCWLSHAAQSKTDATFHLCISINAPYSCLNDFYLVMHELWT